jgi:hypothetical protein
MIARNHRQHARGQVERQAAEQDEQQDRERTVPLEHAALPHAALGVVDELEEIGRALVAAGRAGHLEAVERGEVGGRGRGIRD